MTVLIKTRSLLNPRLLLALLCVYVIWGSSYLAFSQLADEFPPLLLVGTRNLVAGGLLLLYAHFTARERASAVQWRNAALVGFLMMAVAPAFLMAGMRYIDSGFAAVIFAAVPIMVCVLMAGMGQWATKAQWAGTFVGIFGLLLMQHGFNGQQQEGLWWMFGAVLSCAVAAVLGDRLDMPKDVVVSTGAQMLVASSVGLVGAVALGESIDTLSNKAIMAWLYLTFFVSIGGYVSYAYLVERSGPIAANSYAYVNPPIALLAGSWFLGETLSRREVMATTIVLIGALIVLSGQLSKKSSKPARGKTLGSSAAA